MPFCIVVAGFDARHWVATFGAARIGMGAARLE
jgi:hypothetical protein